MTTWTEERNERLRYLWTVKGLSASQIAEALGGVTRNAVIGRARRLGLKQRNVGRKGAGWPRKHDALKAEALSNPEPKYAAGYVRERPSGADRQVVSPATQLETAECLPAQAPMLSFAPSNEVEKISTPEPVASDDLPTTPPADTGRRNISLMELGSRTCRWPQGDPGNPDFSFCGAPCDVTGTYCAHHTERASQKPQKPREAKAEARRVAAVKRALAARGKQRKIGKGVVAA